MMPALMSMTLTPVSYTHLIAKFLIEEGQDKVLVKHLRHELLRQTLPAESLIWICRQRHDASKPLFGLPVGIAMLSLIEQDHMDVGPNRMLRLKNLCMEDKSCLLYTSRCV